MWAQWPRDGSPSAPHPAAGGTKTQTRGFLQEFGPRTAGWAPFLALRSAEDREVSVLVQEGCPEEASQPGLEVKPESGKLVRACASLHRRCKGPGARRSWAPEQSS